MSIANLDYKGDCSTMAGCLKQGRASRWLAWLTRPDGGSRHGHFVSWMLEKSYAHPMNIRIAECLKFVNSKNCHSIP
jgi:hypothetical protein